MSFISEKINNRIKQEDEELDNSFTEIVSSILGPKNVKRNKKQSQRNIEAVGQVLSYFGLKAKETPTDCEKINDIIEAQFSFTGVMYRQVELTKNWYRQAMSVFIASYGENNKPIALFPSMLGTYTFINPDTGKRTLVNKKNSKKIHSSATCFYPPIAQKPVTIKDFLIFIKNCITIWDIISYLLAMAVITFLGLYLPKINHLLTGDVVTYESVNLLYCVLIFAICLLIGNTLFEITKQIILNRIQSKIEENVKAALITRVLNVPVKFFKDYSSGELNQYLSYANNLCSSIVNTIVSTGIAGVFSLVYIFQIFDYAACLVLPSLIVSLLTLGVSLISTWKLANINKKKMKIEAEENGLVFSIITGIQKIRIAGAEKRIFSKWAKLYAKGAKYTFNPPLLVKYNSVFTFAITMIGTIVMYYVAIVNQVSIADYYAFTASYGYVSVAFTSIGSIATTAGTIQPVFELIKPILKSEVETEEGKQIIKKISGAVNVSDVSFKYDGTKNMVLNNISFSIKPEEYVGIVGKTGCGKSTLVRLLLGFEQPSSGNIFYDNLNAANLNMRSVRKNIGTVIQDGKLIEGSVYDNIVLAKPSLSVEDAWEAAEIAKFADDIRAMPMGMETRLNNNGGCSVSGGQRQRLMIARAIAQKPKLLIFDEATSALDNVTQKELVKAIDSLKCTRIMIAHRLSTVISCDRILVIDEGRIAEEGTYEELIKKDGIFADLVRRQIHDN